MAEFEVRYEHHNFTREEELAILQTLSTDQRNLLKSWLCDCVELRASLEYNPESPMAQVQAGGYYAGKLELLRLMLKPELFLSGGSINGGV